MTMERAQCLETDLGDVPAGHILGALNECVASMGVSCHELGRVAATTIPRTPESCLLWLMHFAKSARRQGFELALQYNEELDTRTDDSAG